MPSCYLRRKAPSLTQATVRDEMLGDVLCMKTFPKALAFTFSLMVNPILAEGDLPAGAVARLGSNRFAHVDKIEAIAFSPDGSSIMSIAAGEVVLWDVTTAEKLETHPLPDHMTAVFAPGGSGIELIAIDPPHEKPRFCGDRAHVEMWNALDSSDFYSRAGGSKRSNVRALGFSPDREKVAVVRWKEPMQIFLIGAPSEPVTLEGEAGFSKWMRFSPDGKRLAGCCTVRTGPRTTRYPLRIWNVETGEKIRDIGGMSRDGDYTPDGKWIASCGSGFVTIRDAETGEVVRSLVENNADTNRVAFSPDGKMLALAQGTRLRLWETDSWSELLPASAHDGKINAVEFSPDGKRILTGGNDRKLIEWSWPEATENRRVESVGSSWGIDDVSYSSNGKYFGVTAWINYDDPFSVWDAGTWRVLSRFGKKIGGRTRLEFRSGGGEVLSGQRDGSIAIWEAKTGKLIRKVGSLDKKIGGVAIPRSSEHVAWWAGEYQEIGLRDLRSGKDLRILEGELPSAPSRVVLSSDGRYLSDGAGSLWNLESGERLLEVSIFSVQKSTFSPDSRLLACVKNEHIQIWELLSQSLIHEIGIGEGKVHDLVFSPDGTVIAAAGNGSTLIWDMTGILRDRELPEMELSESEMRTLWNALGNEADPWSAHLATWKLSAAGESAVDFIQRNLSPAVAPETAQLAILRTKLTDESHDVRVFAARELTDLGIELSPEEWHLLRRPLPNFSSGIENKIPYLGILPEAFIAKEIPKKILEKTLEYGPPPQLLPLPERVRSSRALAALERSRSSVSAKALLDKLSEGDPNSPLTKEARSISNRLLRK